MRRIALVVGVAALVAACGREEAAPEARPACVPTADGHRQICGLAPPHRRVEGGTAYEVATINGEEFRVVLPDEPAPSAGLVAVPGLPIRVKQHLTTASPRDAADDYCAGFPTCEPVVVSREDGVTRWDDASGMVRDLGVTTADLGRWTLVLPEIGARAAERVARGLTWRGDAYPRLRHAHPQVRIDADWADVVLWVPDQQGGHDVIRVIPGCELSDRGAGLGPSRVGAELERIDVMAGPADTPDGGRWCAGGRYWVEVSFADEPRLERYHAALRVLP